MKRGYIIMNMVSYFDSSNSKLDIQQKTKTNIKIKNIKIYVALYVNEYTMLN